MKITVRIITFFYLLLLSSSFCYGKENVNSSPLIQVESGKITHSINLKVRNDSYPLTTEDMAGWMTEKNDLRFNPRYSSEIETRDICTQKKSILCTLLTTIQDQSHIQKSSAFFLNTEAVKKYIETLAQKVNQEPVNATLNMQDGKISVFTLNQKGLELDTAASTVALVDYLTAKNPTGDITLPYKEKNADVSIDSIDNLGITSLIGEGHSNFRGSPKNRIFNIKVAVDKFNGTLINPGEEFSFVKNLGPVDGEHGYLPELVIKNDKTEPEFGGGICQVSTTAFRAAIYSGLEITARRNHAYPVGYYNPQGMDSTVYIPKPDLRFINNTPGHILIQTEIVGTELIFRFFGTADGRKVTVDGPHILEKNPDGSMKTTFSQKVTDANDNLIREDVFNSSYESPSKYPHPGATTALTQKPKSWSQSEWDKYLKANKKP